MEQETSTQLEKTFWNTPIKFIYAALFITLAAGASTTTLQSQITKYNGELQKFESSLGAAVITKGCLDNPHAAKLPYTCEVALGSNVYVTVRYNEDKTIEVVQDEAVLFTIADTEGLSMGMNPVTFDNDLNFDGYKDMEILTSAGAYNFSYDYYFYIPREPSFQAELTDIVNPQFDPVGKRILTHYKGRGIGDYYSDNTYELRDGHYVLIRTETQDILPSNPSVYEYVVTELQNRKMVETVRKTLTCEEVFEAGDQMCETGE